MLGNMCLVFFYPCWEETIRRDIATLHGVEESEIKSQIWGDIGKIRNAIPHHRAIATKEVGKCAILKWFYEGEPIWVTPQFFTQLCEELTRFNAGTKHLLPARADNPRPNALHLGFHALFVLNLALALRLRFG